MVRDQKQKRGTTLGFIALTPARVRLFQMFGHHEYHMFPSPK